FGANIFGSQNSLDEQVAHHHFPLAPQSSVDLPVLGSTRRESVSSFRGRLVVLNFYASWCESCRLEAPLLAREQRFLGKGGATLLGVTYQDAGVDSESF